MVLTKPQPRVGRRDPLAAGAAPSERLSRLGLLAPAAILLAGGFIAPLIVMVWYSLTDPAVGVDNFAWYLGDDVQQGILLRTFATAATVTAVCLAVGYPYAYAMVAAGPRLRALLTMLVLVPFWTSLMVRTFAWVILLQGGGPVQQALSIIGLGHIELIRTNLGVVIGMAQILLPFVVMPLFAVMVAIDRRLILASASLGARPIVSFLRVWLPLSLPGVGAGALIVFISSLGFYVTPALLGSPNDSLISQQIFTQVSGLLQWGRAGAMGVVLLIATLVVLAVIGLLIRHSSRRQVKERRS